VAAVQNSATIASTLPQPIIPARSRILSVDAVRGAVMILMAIGHIRDFINAAAMRFSPTDLSQTTAPILPGSFGRDSRPRRHHELSSLRKHEFPVDPAALHGWSAADFSGRLRLHLVGGVRHLGRTDRDALSAVPLVRPTEAASPGLVVELPVR
jgi:hypothetical protein